MKRNRTLSVAVLWTAALISAFALTVPLINGAGDRTAEPTETTVRDAGEQHAGLPQTPPDSVLSILASGDAYFAKKDYLNAKSAYQHALSLDPANETAKEKLKKTMELLRSQKAQNTLFDVAVAAADKLFQAGELDKAKTEYENASRILPNDPYPRNKINEIIRIQVEEKVKAEEYAAAIARADKYYQTKSWAEALVDYRKALTIRSGEKYPQDRVEELIKLIEARKARDEAYQKAIARADGQFREKSYKEAAGSYREALTVKPEESYPKDRIREIDAILGRLANAQADYEKYIALADSAYIDKKYFAARENYQMALSVKPSESYPKEMIAKADKMLSGQEAAMARAQEEQYLRTLATADKLFGENSYELSRAEYLKASNLKPAEAYPKEKIAEIETLLAKASKDKEERYRLAISEGDAAFRARSYESARIRYNEALGIKPGESYPKERIAEIDRQLAADAKQKEADAKYATAIGIADSLFMTKSYLASKAEFQRASGMKPDEVYPKNRIIEINMILYKLEQQKEKDGLYLAAIEKADKLLADKAYAQAKVEYQKALAMKPEETYPGEKLAEIDRALADAAALKALDEKYGSAVAAADRLFNAKSYDEARSGYSAASSMKPAETYPGQRIAEIDRILAELAAARSLDENYKAAVAEADKLLAEKSYDAARSAYLRAGSLKPAEKYPPAKIAEIDGVLAAMAREKQLEEQYATLVREADGLFDARSWEPAREKYLSALKIKAGEQHPKDRLAAIEKTLTDLAASKALDDRYAGILAKADGLLGGKQYEPARAEYENALKLKPSESYPKEKIAEIEKALKELADARALDEKYAGMVAGADRLFTAGTYEQARTEYEAAAALKPAETYPGQRIAEIDRILADRAAAKALDDQYKDAITRADRFLEAKSWTEARAEYSKALGLKPAEKYPQTRISEIDEALAAIARQKALDEEYAATVDRADKLLAAASYEAAKTEYGKARSLKPAEPYPGTKIAEIDRILADAARQKALDEKYLQAVAEADRLFTATTYDLARTAYLDAGKIKPAEQYPKDRVTEIDALLAEQARQKALDEQYRTLLARADQLLADKSYDQAKTGFQEAQKLKPAEAYPGEKIAEIDRALAEIKAREDAYNASLASADQLLAGKKYEEARTEYQNALSMKPSASYPKEKIAEINRTLEEMLGKQKYYERLVQEADASLKEKDYPKAKDSYQLALNVFPSQAYPRDQIAMITARIDSLYRANKSLYDKAVADGDRFFNTFEFDKAIDAYNEAINYLPMEKYPREMIVTIRRTLAENAIVDILNSPVTITSNSEKQFTFTPVSIASRKNNFVYIKIKNLSGKPFNVMMRYGKDKQPNGGVVMRNINPDGKVNERLVSVKDQDIWSREDNNWISLYPQGGDVEVSFIQISRAK